MTGSSSRLQGLLGSAGKHIARNPNPKAALERLRKAENPAQLRSALEAVDLGLAEPARRELIDGVTGDDWHRLRDDLALAVDHSIADRFSPSA